MSTVFCTRKTRNTRGKPKVSLPSQEKTTDRERRKDYIKISTCAWVISNLELCVSNERESLIKVEEWGIRDRKHKQFFKSSAVRNFNSKWTKDVNRSPHTFPVRGQNGVSSTLSTEVDNGSQIVLAGHSSTSHMQPHSGYDCMHKTEIQTPKWMGGPHRDLPQLRSGRQLAVLQDCALVFPLDMASQRLHGPTPTHIQQL